MMIFIMIINGDFRIDDYFNSSYIVVNFGCLARYLSHLILMMMIIITSSV